MSTEPSIPRQRGGYPKLWYLTLPLVAYPLLLVAVRDPLHVFSDLRQYVRPAVFAFQYEEQLLAITFAIVFMASFTLLFVNVDRLRFVVFGTIATAVFYPAVIYVATQYYVYLGRTSPGAFSPLGRGYLMFLAACCAIIAVVRTSPVLRADFLGGRPAPSLRQVVAFFAMGYGLLATAYVYPLLVVFLKMFPDISQVRIARLAEVMDISPLSIVAQLFALIGAAVFTAIYSIAVVNRRRLLFLAAVIPLTASLYNLIVYAYIAFMPRRCGLPEISSCVTYSEIGWLFCLSFILSIVIFQCTLRRFAEINPYRF